MSDMSAQSLIERFLAALNDSNIDAALGLVSEDVVHDPREGGREIGRDKFHWYMGLSARHFREKIADMAIMTAPGGVRVAAEFTLIGTYLVTQKGLPNARGQVYRIPAGMFFEIDDGFITRLTTYLNMAAWRSALN